MNSSFITWFAVGACLVYIVAQDPKVYDWLVLNVQRLLTALYRRLNHFRYDPDSIWVQYQLRRNANKIAREFIKEREKG